MPWNLDGNAGRIRRRNSSVLATIRPLSSRQMERRYCTSTRQAMSALGRVARVQNSKLRHKMAYRSLDSNHS